MKKFTLIAAAAAVAMGASAQYNVEDPSTTAALKGIKKATIDVVLMDADAMTLLEADPNYTVNYVGADDVDRFMYIWDATYVGGQNVGPNVDGGSSYFSLDVANVGWSGGGWNVPDEKPAVNFTLTDETIFHLAYKSQSSTIPPVMMSIFPDVNKMNDAFKGQLFNLGSAAEGETAYATTFGKAPTDEWQAISVKLGDLKKAYGFNYDGKNFHGNYMVLLNGNFPGANICLDAVYFITPTESDGIEEVNVDNTNAPVEYFNLQGVRVANPENGIFVRRQGTEVSKVAL